MANYAVSCLDLLGHESSTSIESILSPVILNMWVMHVSDPFISIDAVEVLEVCFLVFVVRCNVWGNT